jgi:predicted RecA/RadA family phage recombinase
MPLRTATPQGDWRSFKFTCDVSAGVVGTMDMVTDNTAAARVTNMYLVNDTVGCVLEAADYGDEAVLIYHAEKIVVPKDTDSTDVFLPGDRVYWDPATRLCKATYDSADYWIGIAVAAADADVMYVMIDLKGDHAEAEAVLP